MPDKKEDKKEPKLEDKAIDIKGKKYVLVSDRVLYFNENYPNGRIQTELLSAIGSENIYMRATVWPDVDKPDRSFTGYSQARVGDGYINKTSACENCETSAVGRALGFMGIGVIESIASVDEINKANNAASEPTPATTYNLNSPSTPSSDVRCAKCGAGTKISSKTGRAYCENLCWKNPKQAEIPTIDLNDDDKPF